MNAKNAEQFWATAKEGFSPKADDEARIKKALLASLATGAVTAATVSSVGTSALATKATFGALATSTLAKITIASSVVTTLAVGTIYVRSHNKKPVTAAKKPVAEPVKPAPIVIPTIIPELPETVPDVERLVVPEHRVVPKVKAVEKPASQTLIEPVAPPAATTALTKSDPCRLGEELMVVEFARSQLIASPQVARSRLIEFAGQCKNTSNLVLERNALLQIADCRLSHTEQPNLSAQRFGPFLTWVAEECAK